MLISALLDRQTTRDHATVMPLFRDGGDSAPLADGKHSAQVRAGLTRPAPLGGEAEQGRQHCQRDQLGITQPRLQTYMRSVRCQIR